MIHIITPCSRPDNLHSIKQTIPEGCTWTVVVDEKATGYFPTGITYLRPNLSGSWGHPLRNVGMEFILALKAKRGDYIYFLDDDNIIHPDWYESVKNESYPFITWGQVFKNGQPRLHPTKEPRVGTVDTASFMVRCDAIGEAKFGNEYEADGLFAQQMAKWNVKTIDAYLCYYNYLR